MVESEFGVDDNVDLSVLDRKNPRVRPDIDHMQDAVILIGGSLKLLRDEGDKLIIERVTSVISKPQWLDTYTYTIIRIDRETGDLQLHNDDRQQQALSNFKRGIAVGYRFKIPSRVPFVSDSQHSKVGPSVKERQTSDIVRRIYDNKGTLHTYVSGVTYVAPEETRAKCGDKWTFKRVSAGLEAWGETWVRQD